MKTIKYLRSIAAMAFMVVSLGWGLISCSKDEAKIIITDPKNGVIDVAVGNYADVEVRITPNDKYRELEFISNSPNLFWVNQYTGRIYGKAEGTGKMTVREANNKKTKAEVTVKVTAGIPILVESITMKDGFSAITGIVPGKTFGDLSKYLIVSPEWASNTAVEYSVTTGNGTVATVDAQTGVVTAGETEGAYIVKITTADGSNKAINISGAVSKRAAWAITTSHPTQTGDSRAGPVEWLINDPNINSNGECMGMSKVAAEDMGLGTMWFAVDFGEQLSFNSFSVMPRSDARSDLVLYDAQLWMSDDGINYTQITTGSGKISNEGNNNGQYIYYVYNGVEGNRKSTGGKVINTLGQTYTTRYIKFVYMRWHNVMGEGGAIQMRDFNVGMDLI